MELNKNLFQQLFESVVQADEILHGKREPSRRFRVDAARVKSVRGLTGLSQPKFARLLNVSLGTLRNWEQGKREPTGPARALLRAIEKDPRHVLKALAA